MSLQLFYKSAREARSSRVPILEIDRKKMQIFDYLIQNFDRKESNFLVNEKGEIIAIDHGLSLHNARSVPYSPHPPKLQELDLNFFMTTEGKAFLQKLKHTTDTQIRMKLSPLLKAMTIESFIERKNLLLEQIEQYDVGQ